MSADVVYTGISVTGTAFVTDPMTSEMVCLHVGVRGVADVLAGAVEPRTANVTSNAIIFSIPCDRETT